MGCQKINPKRPQKRQHSLMIKRIFIFLIRVYQTWLSPLMGHQCRFAPTCSCYMITAIEKHGTARGIFLGLKRISKCNPWSKGGIDPVP